MKKRLRLFYSGRVQGVGFRYTVQDIANQQKVSGWVKNLDDARVEVAQVNKQWGRFYFLRYRKV